MNEDYIMNLAVEAARSDNLNNAVRDIVLREDLSTEFTKRLVEATNKIAYLARLKDQEDRTFEFELADYDVIMSGLISAPAIEKVASVVSVKDILAYSTEMEKVADDSGVREVTTQQLIKAAEAERRVVESLHVDRDHLLTKIASLSNRVMRSDNFDVAVQHYDNVRSFFKKEASEKLNVRSRDLTDVKYFSETLEKLAEVDSTIEDKMSKIAKAEALIKEAMIPLAIRGGAQVAKKLTSSLSNSAIAKSTKKWAGRADAAGMTADVSMKTTKKTNPWSDLRG